MNDILFDIETGMPTRPQVIYKQIEPFNEERFEKYLEIEKRYNTIQKAFKEMKSVERLTYEKACLILSALGVSHD